MSSTFCICPPCKIIQQINILTIYFKYPLANKNWYSVTRANKITLDWRNTMHASLTLFWKGQTFITATVEPSYDTTSKDFEHNYLLWLKDNIT